MKKQLTELAKFSGANGLPITDYAHLENGILTTSNLETFAQYEVGWEGSGLIPMTQVKKIVAKNTINKVEFVDDVCHIHSGRNVFKYAVDSMDDFPVPPEVKEHLFNLEVDKEFMSLKQFVGKDDLRIAMTGVYFSDDGNIVATDAYKMRWLKRGVKGEFILPAEVFRIPLDTYAVYKSERWVKLVGEYTYYFRVIDATYPAYATVIPQNNPIKFTVDKAELIEQIENAMLCANTSSNAGVFIFHDGTIYAEDVDVSSRYDGKFKTSTCNDEMIIGFDLSKLRVVVNTIEDNEICIEATEPNRGVIINGNSLLMPQTVY